MAGQALASSVILENPAGKVLASQGEGFAATTTNTPLNSGDKIMLGQGGAATLSFESCTINLRGPALYAVPQKAPCAAGENLAMTGNVFITPAFDQASQYARLGNLTRHASALKKNALGVHDLNRAQCLDGKLADLAAMREFLRRNPGVDDSERITVISQEVESCGAPAQPARLAKAPSPPSLAPAPPPLAPVAVTPAFDTNTMLLAGGVVAAVAAGGAAYILLSNNNSVSKP